MAARRRLCKIHRMGVTDSPLQYESDGTRAIFFHYSFQSWMAAVTSNDYLSQIASIHRSCFFAPHVMRGAACKHVMDDNDNDNDNDTLREVPHTSMRAWPYRQERRGHGPTKKSLSYR